MVNLEEIWNPDEKVINQLVEIIKKDYSDLNEKLIFIPPKFYSPNEIILEIQNKTSIGKWLYNLHIGLLEYKKIN